MVESPGLFTTVQDLGRPGFGPLGVSASGAADSLALRLGNRLLGNPPNAAALEMTLQGGKFLFPLGGVVALVGSDFASAIGNDAVPLWTTTEVLPGQVLVVGRSRSGARCYLCVRGGIDVPLVMGSASTHVLSGLGGFAGRALRKGDALALGPEPANPPRHAIHPDELRELAPRPTLRVTEGPQADWFAPSALENFYGTPYAITPDSNRMGLRLQGAALDLKFPRELITEGVSLGCIQVPAGGQPVILFVEQQTTGGYPKIANAVSADLWRVGQLKPGDSVRFERIGFEEARELFVAQERWMESEKSICSLG